MSNSKKANSAECLISAAVKKKLLELKQTPATAAGGRRLAYKNEFGLAYLAKDMNAIARETGLHFLERMPAVELEQAILMATSMKQDISLLLARLLTDFLIAYSNPTTAVRTHDHLIQIQALSRQTRGAIH